MNGYTKLFASIVTSSIWTEDDQTRIVWVTMLALADQHGEVHASIPGLARVAGVSIPACENAISKFLSPDPHSRTPDAEGRRIAVIDGGWEIINHRKYRMLASKEDSKAKSKERQKRWRDRNGVTGRDGGVTGRDGGVTERDGGVTERYASRSVTHSNGAVTQGRDIAEAEAEAEADSDNTYASAGPSESLKRQDPPAAIAPSARPSEPPKQPRKRNPLFDALASVCGLNPESMTKSEGAKVGTALADIRTADPNVTEDEIRRRASNYRKEWPGVELTPTALSGNWTRMAGVKPGPAAQPNGKPLSAEERWARAEMAKIEAQKRA